VTEQAANGHGGLCRIRAPESPVPSADGIRTGDDRDAGHNGQCCQRARSRYRAETRDRSHRRQQRHAHRGGHEYLAARLTNWPEHARHHAAGAIARRRSCRGCHPRRRGSPRRYRRTLTAGRAVATRPPLAGTRRGPAHSHHMAAITR
jgi:hypothetical protein